MTEIPVHLRPVAPADRSRFAALDPGDDLLSRCISCGLCLPSCPTYELTPRERANPRGRIRLMRAVAAGEIPIDDPAFSEAMYYCVGCRACETACPAGVEFGRLVEGARAAVESAGAPGRPDPFPRHLLLERALPYPRRLRWAARLLKLARRFGPVTRLLARHDGLARLLELAPEIPSQSRRWRVPTELDPRDVVGAPSTARGAVALHRGCVQDVVLPRTNADAMVVLAYHGWRVLAPTSFRCCGALHAHQGRRDLARELARANVEAFEASGAERLVTTAAGCGAHLESYRHLLGDDPGWAERAAALSDGVVDVTEHLVEEGLRRPRRPFGIRVTYDDPCHLIHGQRVAESPRLVLGAIRGLDVVPLAESSRCCGSAGIYNVTHPEAAGALLERKVTRIVATGAELVLTGNPGCHLWIERGLRSAGSPMRVMHPISLLRSAYELPPPLPRGRSRTRTRDS